MQESNLSVANSVTLVRECIISEDLQISTILKKLDWIALGIKTTITALNRESKFYEVEIKENFILKTALVTPEVISI